MFYYVGNMQQYTIKNKEQLETILLRIESDCSSASTDRCQAITAETIARVRAPQYDTLRTS